MEPVTMTAAAGLALKANDTLVDTLAKVREKARNASTNSLSKFTKASIVEAPCFIQDSIAEESVINDIIKNLYNIYIGYIICALQMEQQVIDGRRVRDVLTTVSTQGAFESIQDEYIDSNALVGKLCGSMEGIVTTTTNTHSDKQKNDWEEITKTSSTVTTHSTDPESKYNSKQNKWNTTVGNDFRPEKNITVPIASGRYITITMATGPDSPPVQIPILVQVNSRIVPTPVFEYIFGRDYNSSIIHRFLLYRSGEIRFIKDFIFGIDIAQRRAKALKADEDNALIDILRQQNKSKLKGVVQASDPHKSHNLANAIIIADEYTVKDITKKVGINLERPFDRQRFFNKIYGLFIVLVDSRYSRVTIYTNGIDQSATYSYNDLKSAAASDKLSLKDVVEYLTKGQSPRF